MISRQKLVGWILVIVSAGYLAYLVRTRLLVAGVPLEKREWLEIIGLIATLMIGTINIRIAAMRQRRRTRDFGR